MNREIEFKALDLINPHIVDDKKTIVNILSKQLSGYSQNYGSYFSQVTDSKKQETEQYLLLEFTGLRCKHDEKIFEYDVIQDEDNNLYLTHIGLWRCKGVEFYGTYWTLIDSFDTSGRLFKEYQLKNFKNKGNYQLFFNKTILI